MPKPFGKRGQIKLMFSNDSFWNNSPDSSEEIDLTVQLSGAMLIEAATLLDNEGFLSDE